MIDGTGGGSLIFTFCLFFSVSELGLKKSLTKIKKEFCISVSWAITRKSFTIRRSLYAFYVLYFILFYFWFSLR